MAAELRFDEILRVLIQNEVEFIVVGGVAAILQGSPLTTEDVDVVYLSSEENNFRLAKIAMSGQGLPRHAIRFAHC